MMTMYYLVKSIMYSAYNLVLNKYFLDTCCEYRIAVFNTVMGPVYAIKARACHVGRLVRYAARKVI